MKKRLVLFMGMILTISALAMGCGDTSAAEGSLKTGLGIVTDISGSTDASAEAEGTAQADVTIAAVTVDVEGRIVACTIDMAQTVISFDTDGKITTDLTTELQTKQEAGDAYGMKAASSIGREWNEQADAFAAYCVGKTADEVAGIAVTESGTAADADLSASCTVHIGGFQEVVVKAVNNAVGKNVD